MIRFGWVLWYINHCRLFNAQSSLYIYIKFIWLGLVGFYGISTIVGYLMPNPLYTFFYIYINFIMFRSGCSLSQSFIIFLLSYNAEYFTAQSYTWTSAKWFIYLLFIVTWPPLDKSISTVVFVGWRFMFNHTVQYWHILLISQLNIWFLNTFCR